MQDPIILDIKSSSSIVQEFELYCENNWKKPLLGSC